MAKFGIDSNMVFDADGKSVATRLSDHDTSLDGLSSSLADITSVTVNAKTFGVKGDGTQDDITFLETALSNLPSGAILNLPPKSTIKISRPWVITKGDFKIKGNGSKIFYTGTQSLGSDNGINRYYGAITLQGNLDSTKQLSITAITPNFYDTVLFNTLPMTKISTGVTDATTKFAVGDVVYLDARNFAGWTWAQDFSDNPAILRSPAKVISISGGDIFVDINPDFIFGGTNFSGTITKMNDLKNITIEDLFFEDGNNATVPTSPTNSERESWVGGIHAYYCSNLVIKNFESSKHRYPAIMTNQVYNFSIEDGRFYYPRAVSAGCGYGIQNNGSTHGNFQKLRGIKVRHLCDFSGGGHHYVEDAKQPDTVNCTFDCHGIGEFDVNFNYCIGSLNVGNGIAEFPTMTSGIKLNNFRGSVGVDWAKNVKITNSEIYLLEERRTNRIVDFSVQNSKIYGTESKISFYASSRNNVYQDSKFLINTCEVEIQDLLRIASGEIFILVGYENVYFTNNPKLKNKRQKTLAFTMYKCKYVKVTNNTIKDLGFTLQNTTPGITEPINSIDMDYGSVLWNNNIVLDTWGNPSHMPFLNIVDGTLTKYKISVTNSFYDALALSRWIRFGTTYTGGIFLTVSGNTFVRNIEEALGGSTLVVKTSNNNIEGYTGTSVTT